MKSLLLTTLVILSIHLVSSSSSKVKQQSELLFFQISKEKACSGRFNWRILIQKEFPPIPGKGKDQFFWVKKWGYEAVSYLFDFLDPVLQGLVLKEFSSLFYDVINLPRKSNFSDMFDFLTKLSKRQVKSLKLAYALRRFKRYYKEDVYEVSASAPQIHQAFVKFGWPGSNDNPEFIKRYILKYDMNFDGRLNPRELILASIYERPYWLGSGNCKHCYSNSAELIFAFFNYLDCNEDGFLSAEEIWHNLSALKRNTQQYDIFAFGNDENIRTAAINDFILKNMQVREGYVNKHEFLSGILLGYWDRHTDERRVVMDDSLTLKNLRWEDDGMKDISLYRYYKAVEEHKLDLSINKCH